MLAMKEFRSHLKGLPDLLNYGAMVDNGIVLNKDGSFTTAFYFRGQDLASSTNEELAAVSSQINAALMKLGTGWMLHIDSIRVPATSYPDASRSFFPDATTLAIEAERRAQHHQEGAHFDNVYALALTFQVPPDLHSKIAAVFVDDDSAAANSKKEMNYTQLLNRFKGTVADVVGAFSARLQLRQMNSDDLLTYLHGCLTGVHHPVNMPGIPMYLDAILGSKDFYTGLAPRVGDKHIRVVTLFGFPGDSQPGILDMLNQLPIEYRWSTRFIALDPRDAEKRLNVYRRNWFQKRHGLMGLIKAAAGGGEQTWQNSDAVRMAVDADSAVNENSEGLVRYGFYTATVVVMANDGKTADDNAREIAKLLGNSGFPSFVEDINAVEAFLGSLPGHGFQNVRRPLMHTLNLADLLPLTAVWSGSDTNPCPFYPPNSPPLTYAATTGATPFRFSLHNGDLGHAQLIGPPGAGKSTKLGLIMAQHFRYPNAQVFCFDKGYSAYVLAMASGGSHYDIAGDHGDLSFCPLAQIDTPTDKAWAKEYVELLVTLQLEAGRSLTPHQREEIHNAIERLASGSGESRHRTITDFRNTVQDEEIKSALSYYAVDGTLGHLLDAEADSLRDGRFIVFEMEHLMNMGDKALIPVLTYLFRQVEKRLRGQPTLLVIDEAWAMLRHPAFREKIREWLKVLRKANCAVVFATQNLSDVMKSSISDVIIESTPTKILLPNAEAATENVRPAYQAIGLNEKQIVNLSVARPKRDYYILSASGRRMIDLGLGKVALAFIGASGKEDVARARELISQHGEEWPYHWMRERGVPSDWADFWYRQHKEFRNANA